jgi:hypothetical protein
LFFNSAALDPDLHTRERFSNAASPRFARQIHAEKRRGLSQTVTDRELPAERFEFRGKLRIKGRAAGCEKPEVFAKMLVQRTEDSFADTEAQPCLGKATEREQGIENSARNPSRGLNLSDDPRIEGAVEPRHTDHRRRFAFGQRAQQLRTG